jgi:hypothetical protein
MTGRRNKDHNLSLHVIILGNEAAGESAVSMYVPYLLSFSDADLDIIIITGEFVCFRLRLTMDTMTSDKHMRKFGRKSSSSLKRRKHIHFFTREAGRP